MKKNYLGMIFLTMLSTSPLAQAAYPIETYPEDIREVGYPNTTPQPRPVPPLSHAEAQQMAKHKTSPVVVTEHRKLLPLLICEPNIAKEDKHLVKSCHADADKIYLTTQQGVELITAKDSGKENLYLGKHNRAHEIKNVLANDRVLITLITIKNKRYSMELVVKDSR